MSHDPFTHDPDALGAAVRRLWLKIWRGKRHCFHAVFLPAPDGTPSADSERVLAHLRRFCRAEGTTYDPDPREHARREGRREVWLEINRFLTLDDAQVRELAEVESDYGD